jgi:hypothetical protein
MCRQFTSIKLLLQLHCHAIGVINIIIAMVVVIFGHQEVNEL